MDELDMFNVHNEEEEDANMKPEDRKHLFKKELLKMLYGFGDDKVPYDKTLDLLEIMVCNYVRDISVAALNVGKPDKITLEDIHYLISRDPKKYGRVRELLSANQEIKVAKKKFEDNKF